MEIIKYFFKHQAADVASHNGRLIVQHINQLRQWAQSVRESQDITIAQWQRTIEIIEFHCQCANKYLQGIYQLPGVTGEKNELWFESRGLTAIIIDQGMEIDALAAALTAALVNGNPVNVCVHPTLEPYANQLLHQLKGRFIPADMMTILPWENRNQAIESPVLRLACLAGSSDVIYNIAQRLAERQGIIIPIVIEMDPSLKTTFSDPRLSTLFGCEKTYTVNTSAIGGNTTLLEMGSNTNVAQKPSS